MNEPNDSDGDLDRLESDGADVAVVLTLLGDGSVPLKFIHAILDSLDGVAVSRGRLDELLERLRALGLIADVAAGYAVIRIHPHLSYQARRLVSEDRIHRIRDAVAELILTQLDAPATRENRLDRAMFARLAHWRTTNPQTPTELALLEWAVEDLRQHDADRAVGAARRLVVSAESLSGLASEPGISAQHHLAVTLADTGDHTAAQELVSVCIQASESLHGPKARLTLKRVMSQALFFQAAGDLTKAEEALEHVLEDLSNEFGDTDPATLEAKYHLADVLVNLGSSHSSSRGLDALELASDVLAARRQTVEIPEARDIDTLLVFANALHQSGRWATARDALVSARMIASRQFGSDDAITRDAIRAVRAHCATTSLVRGLTAGVGTGLAVTLLGAVLAGELLLLWYGLGFSIFLGLLASAVEMVYCSRGNPRDRNPLSLAKVEM